MPADAGTQRGKMGRGLPRAPGDGFLLPVSTRTSFAGKTVGRRRKDGGTTSCPRTRVPRGGRRGEASPAPQGWIPAPRFHEDKLRRKDGGASSCPRTRVPRGGRWDGASPARQGWIPAPRFHEDKLRRKDGGAPSCPRTRVPRGGRWGGASPAPQGWIPAFAGMTVGRRRARGRGYPEGERWGGGFPRAPGMDSCFRRKDGGASQERRWNHVVPADAGTQRGAMGRGLSRAPGMDSCSPFPRGQASQE